jgi:pimeloyl-ACP methyl ester carboxylesterase
MMAAACTLEAPGPDSTSPSSTVSGNPNSEPTRLEGAKFSLGALTLGAGSSPSCRLGRTCEIEFHVDCPNVQREATGAMSVTAPSGSARGLVVFFLGGLGTGESGETINRDLIRSLALHGIEVVLVRWEDSWLQSASGEDVGPKRLACRPATAIFWVHEHLYKDLTLGPPGPRVCGFCISGNSGGATQSAYALAFYGLAGVIDAAVLSGGPPHAALDEGCLQEEGLGYIQRSADIIDLSYGFPNGGGPCERHDPAFEDHWKNDSVDVGGDYDYPDTRVVFIFGSDDFTEGPPHGKLYLAKLRAADSPFVSVETIEGMPHTLQISPSGRIALQDALLADAG